MPSDITLKAMNTVHRLLLGVTRGRKGWFMANMPVLELVTTGRKSGKQRAVMLTSPLQINNEIVIVASRGGDDQHPAWFVNLRDNPKVLVRYMGGDKKSMTARIASNTERETLWPQITTKYKGYGEYQTRTSREIPLILLAE
jgi:deazaflavin-dependent oxidoreductase (nitroreductase family)